ncbi:MAG: TRAP transporter substrate-binding protein [Sulfurospirillum sp.]|nr:TRAP transporter substrate-binding protein [Sulfurospirillum sp.]
MKKNFLIMLAMLSLPFAMFAKSYTINLGLVTTPESFHYMAAKKFKDIVEEKSNGEITVIIRHSSSVGNETSILQQIQLNALQMGVITAGPMDKFVPSIKAIDFPFIFDSYAKADAILDGEIGQNILKSFTAANLVGYHFLENGFRNITNSKKAIVDVKDVDGLKIRVMNSQLHIGIWKQIGANPTPMPWPIYTQLSQNVIDGQENPLAIIHQYKLYEVQKYLTLTRHVYSALVFVGSKEFHDSLPKNYQDLVFEATKEAANYERKLNREKANFFLEDLRAKGMIINENPNMDSFKQKVAPLKDQFNGDSKIYLEQILAQ